MVKSERNLPLKIKKKRKKKRQTPLIDDRKLKQMASLLKQQLDNEKSRQHQQITKTILCLGALGITLPFVFMSPNTARIPAWLVRQLFAEYDDWKQWRKFNLRYLRKRLRQLEKKGWINLQEENNQVWIRLKKRGIEKLFELSTKHLAIPKPARWDGKWRIVIYDIPKRKKVFGDVIQNTLKKLKFYQLQESVYLYPYRCRDVIELLRTYYGLRENIKVMTVERIENEEAYRVYFGL